MRIFWIEPEIEQIDLFQPGLLANGYSLQIAYDGYIGWKLIQEQTYDLILLTPNLTGIHGYELARSIRHQDPFIPLLMLGTLGYSGQEFLSLQAGANRFLARPLAEEQLIVSIQTLYQQKKDRSAQWIRLPKLELNLTDRTVYRDGHCINLTERECQLLAALMTAQGQVLSKEILLDRVWKSPNYQRLNTVEVYINLLRKKIDQNFSSTLIQTILGAGYMLAPLHQAEMLS